MKRLPLILLFTCVSLWAFEFNADAWGNYLIFDPDQRELLLSYPVSWLRPDDNLLEKDYQDSSYTYGLWEQILTVDETREYQPGMSSRILAKYVPYSLPQRWSAGLEFINYKGGNSTNRTDAALHYRHQKGNITYFHTSNTQKIKFASSATLHSIRSHALNIDYMFNDRLQLKGSININRIDQSDAAETRNYDIHHEQLSLNYSILDHLKAYGTFHYWNYSNDDQQGNTMLFLPGLRYDSGILSSHVSMRISPSTVHPIVELSLTPGPFYLTAFTKTRSSRLDIQQAANQYYGIKSGLTLSSTHHLLTAAIAYTYDVVRTSLADSVINNDFETFKTGGEYRLKTKFLDLYLKGHYQNSMNPRAGYYDPVRSIMTGGLVFRGGLAKGKLQLTGDFHADYILHDDPDMVSFDPSKLIYTLNAPADLVGDWKANLNLSARIQEFAITANISLPLKLTSDLGYFLYEGIYTSSDFYIGNVLYAGLSIEWLWWK
jgi:hypothetical protein